MESVAPELGREEQESRKPTGFYQGPAVDPLLQGLVQSVDTGLWDFGITLNVGGLLISGQLISAKGYIEALGREIAESASKLGPGGQAFGERFQESFAKVGSMWPQFPEQDPENPALHPIADCIHIRNARIYTPRGVPGIASQRGILWRGRLAAVDGWFLGVYVPD